MLHIEDALHFPILIGDIGGTNARFGLLSDAHSQPVHFPILQTGDFPTIEAAIEVTLRGSGLTSPRSAILAIAGPVQGDDIPLTNAGWVIRPRDMLAALGLTDIIVVNDFEAQALAVAASTEQDREQIGRGDMLPAASRVVLGPGTGLGVAGLLHARDTWFPIPGEGGHVDVGPRSKRDYQIWPHLDPIEGRISAEQLLCGRGILNIYRAICTTDGVQPAITTPADVTTAALAGRDIAAQETVALFATYLGRVAGDFALTFMARGGVFLAGGISQKILPALKLPAFRGAFEDKAPHSRLLSTVPTYVVTHPAAALWGLAAYARNQHDFGLSTDGRRWR